MTAEPVLCWMWDWSHVSEISDAGWSHTPLQLQCGIGYVARQFVFVIHKVDWNHHRQQCCPMDAYSELHPVMRLLQNLLAFYEKWLCFGPFRYSTFLGRTIELIWGMDTSQMSFSNFDVFKRKQQHVRVCPPGLGLDVIKLVFVALEWVGDVFVFLLDGSQE